jgi:imidazolonepropionase-like amidohydrolase
MHMAIKYYLWRGESMKKLIKCGMLFRATNEATEQNMAIVIDGNKISDVLGISQVGDLGNFDVIDLSEKFVMPGLIDAHTHCWANGSFQDLTDGAMYSISIPTYALRGLKWVQDDLMGGFTTIRDAGAPGFADVAIRDAINEGYHWGPRMMVAGLPINATGGHGDSSLQPPYSGGDRNNVRAIVCGPDQARQAARFNFKYGADYIKFMSTYGVMSVGDDPGPQELTYEEMRAIVEVAEFRGKTTATHAHGLNGIRCAVKAGVTSVEHGTYIDEETAEMMIEKGTYLVPTIIASLRMLNMAKEGEIADYAMKKARMCQKVHSNNIRMAYEKGVKIALGTDVAAPYVYHGTQAEELVLMVEKIGMKPEYVLISATKTGSELLRWDNKIGTIEKGKLADIIAVDGNPLVDMKVMKNVSFVMKDGTVYKNN